MFDFFRRYMKLFMGLLFVPLVIGFVLFGVQGYDKGGDAANRVAEVAGHFITRQELDQAHRREVEQRLAANPQLDRAFLESEVVKQLTLDRLLNQRVLALAAQERHVRMPDARLVRELAQDPGIAALRRPDGQLDMQRYQEALKTQGLTPEQYENGVRQELAQRQLLSGVSATAWLSPAVVQAAVRPWLEQREIQVARFVPADFVRQVQVTDEEVRAYYEAHASRFQTTEQVDLEYLLLDLDTVAKQVKVDETEVRSRYEQRLLQLRKQGEQRRARHILLTVPAGASAADKEKTRVQAQGLLAQLRQDPSRFPALAKAHSQDPGSASQGGDLGFFARGSMDKAFEDAVFALNKGQVADLVESEFGVHMVQLLDVRAPELPTFEASRAALELELKRGQASKLYADTSEALSNALYEPGEGLQAVADKLGLPLKNLAGLTRQGHPTAALWQQPKLLQAVFAEDALRTGRRSEPVEVQPQQTVVFRVLQHRPASTRPFAEVAALAKQALLEERALALSKTEGLAKQRSWASGEAPSAALASAKTVSRQQTGGFPPAVLDAALSAKMAPGRPAWVGVDLGTQGYAVLKVLRVLDAPALPTAEAQALRQQLTQLWSQAETQAYLASLKKQYGVKILQKLEKG